MAQTIKSEKAKLLRKKGFSIGEISIKLNVGKSTISYWCRDISLNKKQLHNIALRQKNKSVAALNIYVEKLRTRRLKRISELMAAGKNKVKKITKRDLFMIGLALYWAEGYKKGNNEVGFTNSDPAIIQLIIKWFKEVYFIKSEDFILRISINYIHRYRAEKITEYWSKITGIVPSQFTKISFIQSLSKKVYLNNETYYGTLRVKVRRGSELRQRILGSIQGLHIYRSSLNTSS